MPKIPSPPVHGSVRLTITINEQEYAVIPKGISEFYDCPTYLLRKKGADAEYTVRVTNLGVSCSCPDYCARKRSDDACKHIKALQVFYMLR